MWGNLCSLNIPHVPQGIAWTEAKEQQGAAVTHQEMPGHVAMGMGFRNQCLPDLRPRSGCLSLPLEMPKEEGLAGSDLAADAQAR